MAKFLVKLALAKKTVPVKIEFGRHVVTEMTGNANFMAPNPVPSPTLLVITTVTDELEDAYDDRLNGGFLFTAALHLKEAEYDLKITALGDYVNNVAQGSETIIKSAGMETRKIPGSSVIPEQVVNLRVLLGLVSGELRLRWKKISNAKLYFVYMSEEADVDANYSLIGTPAAARFTVADLIPGRTYWFKVKAVGAGGAGQLSDPGKLMAT